MPDQDRFLIETERIRSVFQQAPLTLLVTVLNATLTAFVLAPVSSHTLLSAWVAAIMAVSGIRWTIRQRLLRRARDSIRPRVWAAISILGSLTTGTLWGIGAIILSPAAVTYQLFLSFVIGGMCAGTTSVNSAHMPTVLAFVLPASLPLAARFLAGGSTPLFAAGIMTLVFAAALSLTSLRTHRAFGERIQLHLALSRQGRELTETNERLRREVAEKKETEAILHQSQKMEAIGHLTGGIAHDFNNLLQIVSGNLGMIERAADNNARILGHVRAAEQAAQQGARLTNSLLAFARRQSLQVERVNLNSLLQEFQPILLRALNNMIRFQIFLASDLPECDADASQFQSAILNIAINARDAMPKGGALTISTGVLTLEKTDLPANPDAGPGRYVSVSAQDTGSGMSAEVLAQAFEPFFTTKEVGKGSGLGLSQIYGFARQSGGFVNLRSEPGAGTCVTLCLPVAGE